ncbi:MAG: MBL fold metallo-hydrolase [Candidatus Geothermarchaeales archaeon]
MRSPTEAYHLKKASDTSPARRVDSEMWVERLIVGPLQVNCYIVADDKGRAIVIDPGGDAGKILAVVDQKDLSVEHIVNTHVHFDHILGVEEVRRTTGANFLIHREEATVLDTARELSGGFMGYKVEFPEVGGYLQDGDMVQAGALRFEVLFTPGHTPGGISLLVEDSAFTGDTLFAGGVGRTDLPGGSWEQLMESIRHRLLPLGDDVKVYPGHGPFSTIGMERRSNPFMV